MPKRGIPDQPVPRPAAHSRTSPPDGRPLPDLCPPTPVPADDSALSATAQALDDQGTPRLLAGKSSLDRHHRQRGEDAVFGIKLHGHSGEHSLPAAGAVQRTDPTKSDVSVRVNISSMYRASCPLAARGIDTSSSTRPSCINWHLTTSSDSLRFRIAAAVLSFPARRTGKRASVRGRLAPTPATPMPGRPKRRTPPMGGPRLPPARPERSSWRDKRGAWSHLYQRAVSRPKTPCSAVP